VINYFSLDNSFDKIIFSSHKSNLAHIISSVTGLSSPESWGSWSSSDVVTLQFSRPLPEKFEVHLIAHAFGQNIGKEFIAHVGAGEVKFTLGATPEKKIIRMSNPTGQNIIKINIPFPVSPKESGLGSDERKLGIGFGELWIVPL
jgi:phosphoglycerol transferase